MKLVCTPHATDVLINFYSGLAKQAGVSQCLLFLRLLMVDLGDQNCQADLHQICIVGTCRYMRVDGQSRIRFAIAQGTLLW